ncbi:hypothetical protein RHGRI_012818 [Rhododendron griersonianum]|uniref:Fcf2 pre-rRNA processing C-terminal domain-containing protein n=2 Tax=Rhododendron griersonianum TaxID=479676 RepID=A0AAV6KT43_9ERIC|nr:hypothetical protein RHGRI_012818 [Rhododendron griersonianum]
MNRHVQKKGRLGRSKRYPGHPIPALAGQYRPSRKIPDEMTFSPLSNSGRNFADVGKSVITSKLSPKMVFSPQFPQPKSPNRKLTLPKQSIPPKSQSTSRRRVLPQLVDVEFFHGDDSRQLLIHPPAVNRLNAAAVVTIVSAAVCSQIGLRMAETAERKPVIGLSWEPKLPLLPSVTKNGSAKSQPLPPETVAAYRPMTELVDGMFLPPNDPKKLNKLMRKQVKNTAGKNWFDMPAPTITPELKKDLQLLKVGTVIESASDFYTGRLTKNERKATLADELLSDQTLNQYRKRKVREINEKNRPAGVDKWKIRGKQSWKRAKQRRH